jgi:hypothetical protein
MTKLAEGMRMDEPELECSTPIHPQDFDSEFVTGVTWKLAHGTGLFVPWHLLRLPWKLWSVDFSGTD